jgi:hypothetical protein
LLVATTPPPVLKAPPVTFAIELVGPVLKLEKP